MPKKIIDTDSAKSIIRSKQKELRAKVGERKRKISARSVAEKFLANLPITKSDKIAGYFPVNNELDIMLLLEILSDQKNIIALPCVNEDTKHLTFREYKIGDQLYKNKFGILEPGKYSHIIMPDIVIVPLVAFDEDCYRIGYGGGYYDKTISILHENIEIISIGVGYDFQKIKKLPRESHDIPLDCIITEKEIILP